MKKALLFLCFLILAGCGKRIILRTEIPHLIAPPYTCERPSIDLKYKVEGKRWFCVDEDSIEALREYIYCMESTTTYCINQIDIYESYRVESGK